jgi:hypothetical protein
MTKAMIALPLTIGVLTTCGCGGARYGANLRVQPSSAAATVDGAGNSAAHVSSPGGYLKNDGDKDADDSSGNKGGVNDDKALLATYGGPAHPSDRRAITTVVKSYYASAVREDGATACRLLSSNLVSGLVESQSELSQDELATCPAALRLLFKRQHGQLIADEIPAMSVTAVNVKANVGLVTLGFRALPEAEILVSRERHAWKIDALLDSEMP